MKKRSAVTRQRRKAVTKESRMTIGSDPLNIHRVENFLLKINRSVKVDDERFGILLVVVTEAVNNAIIHGNNRNSLKHVLIVCSWNRKQLKVKVKDEGAGFDPSMLPSPIHEDNLMRESGRGVFLMRELMEKVTYNKKGNEVTMMMKL